MFVLEREKEENPMQDVIERLRLSKQTKAQEIEEEGRRNGIEWAKYHAEYDELRRMAQIATWANEDREADSVYTEVTQKDPDEEVMADFYLIDVPPFKETGSSPRRAG